MTITSTSHADAVTVDDIGDVVAGIDHLIDVARPVRQQAWRDPDARLAVYALDDMIHLLAEVKRRLQDEATRSSAIRVEHHDAGNLTTDRTAVLR